MEQRLANAWRMTVNEKKFIETALESGLRIDGRNLYDYRKLSLNFGKEDGTAEVHLGETRVLGIVTAQLVQPYRDRPNEGSLSIFTEFSPMADPSFEPGRPGDSAVELGRVIDRGLRESRAVDTESLCVLAGKLVWAIRVDLHILDNGGNLVDAANIAALAALSTFRRPECSLGGEDGQEVIVHPPEAREPLSLMIHHLPIAVTFAFLSNESTVVIDPTHFEEAVMGGRMTTTLNTNGDICAIQKAGGEGVSQSVIMHCLRIAATKAADMTSKIKDAVEAYNIQRALKKIKRHPAAPVAMNVSSSAATVRGNATAPPDRKEVDDISRHQTDRVAKLKLTSNKTEPVNQTETKGGDGNTGNFIGGPSSWDPSSEGVDPDLLRSSLASRALTANNRETDSKGEKEVSKAQPDDMVAVTMDSSSSAIEASKGESQMHVEKTLKDAVKPKNKRKKKASAAASGN